MPLPPELGSAIDRYNKWIDDKLKKEQDANKIRDTLYHHCLDRAAAARNRRTNFVGAGHGRRRLLQSTMKVGQEARQSDRRRLNTLNANAFVRQQ
jgi:hypothetical protein